MTLATAEYLPGNLVRARGREWVVQSDTRQGDGTQLLRLRPLGGADDDIVTLIPDLEFSPVEAATCRVLERLGKLAPGAMDAYEKLLPHQPAIYRSHLGWLEHHSPEEVRDAMLTIRCRGAGSLAEFETLLGEARARRRNR